MPVSINSLFEVERFFADFDAFFATVLPPAINVSAFGDATKSFENPLNAMNQLVHRFSGEIEIHDCIRIEFVSVGISGKVGESAADVSQLLEQTLIALPVRSSC